MSFVFSRCSVLFLVSSSVDCVRCLLLSSQRHVVFLFIMHILVHRHVHHPSPPDHPSIYLHLPPLLRDSPTIAHTRTHHLRSGYWAEWTFVAASLGVLIIVDFMFMDGSQFVFDPNPRSWNRRQD